MNFGPDVHGSQRKNPDEFGDPLTFHLMPQTGLSFKFIQQTISTSMKWSGTK